MKVLLPLFFLIPLAIFAQSPELVIPGGHGEFIRGLAVHPNGTLVASSAGPEVKIWRAADGKLLKTLVLSGASSFSSYIDNLAFSNDGRYLAGTSGSHLHLIGTDALEVIKSVKLSPEIYESGFQVGTVAAHPTQNAFYYAIRKQDQIYFMRYDLGSSQVTKAASFAYPGSNPRAGGSISWNANGKLALLNFIASNDAAIVNLDKGTGSPYPGGLAYLPDGNLLLHQRINGRLLILAARQDGTKVWEKNIFDASLKQFGYYYNNLVIDEKAGRFYYGIDQGGMVAGNFRTGTDVDTKTIEARTQDAKIVVRGTTSNDRIAELRLYHNGKLLGGTSRGLGVEDDTPEGNERTYTVALLPGENTFRAVAVNGQRTESAPALLLVNYIAPAAPPKISADGITLHLLTIGINEYKNPRYNLNYAEADATGLEATLKTGMSSIVGDIRLHSIRNASATRSDILRAIATVTAEADADDVFIFYYAGHGVMSEGTRKDFFLVPHDVTQLYGNDQGLAAKGISATELKALAAGMPAQKQLYILDACQSAGAVQSIAMRGAAEEKAIAQLARSTGTHWLTASGSEQFAGEFDQLGHGAFTYALLEALSGKAAGSDNRISVNELKAYLDAVVPEITEKYNGQAQYPASYGFGQDFPVGVKR